MTTTLHELGSRQAIGVDVAIQYNIDTSGECGCDLNSVQAMSVVGDDYEVTRAERPDWFAWLDAVAERIVDSRLSELVAESVY